MRDEIEIRAIYNDLVKKYSKLSNIGEILFNGLSPNIDGFDIDSFHIQLIEWVLDERDYFEKIN
jgi:hypothetical protein